MLRKPILFYIIFLYLFAIFFSFGEVFAKEKKIIKVGYTNYANLIEKKSDGNFDGYGVNYLAEIAKYTGWEYEFINNTWGNSLDSLKKGDIDLMLPVKYTDERNEYFDYSKYPIGFESSVIYTNQADAYYNDAKFLEGKRIGIVKKSFESDTLTHYAKEYDFSYIPIEYESTGQMLTALEQQNVDAILSGSLFHPINLKVIAKFYPEPLYFITRKDDIDVMRSLNDALTQIKTHSPYFDTALYQKYYGNSDYSIQPFFTREEAELVQNMPPIKIGLISNRHPIAFKDASTGEMAGISKDILTLVSEITGLKFEFVPIPSGVNPLYYLQTNDISFVVYPSIDTPTLINNDFIIPSSLLTTSLMIVGRSGESYSASDKPTVAILSGLDVYDEIVKKNFPNCKITHLESVEECLNAVKNHKTDLMIQNSYVLDYQLQNPQFEDLAIHPTALSYEQISIACLKSIDPRLITLLNKTINSLPKAEIDQCIIKNTVAKPYKFTIKDLIYKYEYPLICISILASFCIFLILYTLKQRHQHIKILQAKNKELSKAILQVKTVNEAKSRFLSNISQELRAPMNAIIGITELAKQNISNIPKMKFYLTKISFASKILQNIVNDVLDMSAIETSKLKISHTIFDLTQTLSTLNSMYYAQCKEKNIEFDLIIRGMTEEIVRGDQMRLNQILLNLLFNALKRTKQNGKIQLIVTQEDIKENKVYLQFTIFDTGIGIPSEIKKEIFHTLEQAFISDPIKFKGSGLELSIVKNLVDCMDGTISLKNVEKKGNFFTVTLPFGLVEKKSSKVPPLYKNIRILFIDDNVNSVEYASFILNQMNLTYDYAKSGESALDFIKAEYYELCFINYDLINKDPTLLKKLRETSLQNIFITIFSAYYLLHTIESIQADGANLVLTKPFFKSTLFDAFIALSTENHLNESTPHHSFNFSGHCVLLLESNDTNLKILYELLNITGIKIITANNGQKIVDKFLTASKNEFDLIFIDIDNLSLGGYQAIERIRNCTHDCAKTIPIIAIKSDLSITGEDSSEITDRIIKPIDARKLYPLLKKYIK